MNYSQYRMGFCYGIDIYFMMDATQFIMPYLFNSRSALKLFCFTYNSHGYAVDSQSRWEVPVAV
jgi:hypothetical protein